MPDMKTPCYAYLRVSGKGQVDGDGFDRQLLAIRRYCDANSLAVAHVYQERGVSGTVDGMDRPTWIEMLAAIMANGVRTIVVERLDRLARDLMIQEHIIADLQRRGITLISAAEPDLCSADPSRKLLRQIMGAIHEYDRTMVVLKLRGARQRMKANTGRCEGVKPFGTRPGEGIALQRARELQAAGHPVTTIARTLDSEGHKTRGGGPWQSRVLGRLLRS